MKLVLYSAKQGYDAIKGAWPAIKEQLQVGNKLVLTVTKQSKSREQEEKYHAIIGEIAEQASHLGAKWSAEDWKRLLVDKFIRDAALAGEKIVQNLDGNGIVQLGFQTRKFTVDQASQFIEFLHAWGAENGITFREP